MLVSVDPLVALKIIEHCSSFGDSPVTGQLVGLDFENELEPSTVPTEEDEEDGEGEVELVVQVANSFPNIPVESYRQRGVHRDHSSMTTSEYETTMLKHFRSNNIDHGTVGWYMNSSFPVGFLTTHFLETHLTYQKTIENAIFLAVDLVNCQLGGIGLKAYRINPDLVEFIRNRKVVLGTGSDKSLTADHFKYDELLEEIPLIIKCTQLFASPSSKEALVDTTRMKLVRSFGGSVKLDSKNFCQNVDSFVGRLTDRMQEISEYVLQEQGKIASVAGKKKKRQEEYHLGSLSITELTFARLLMLEYSKYLVQLDSLLRSQ